MENYFVVNDRFIYRDSDQKVLIKYIGNEGCCDIPEGTEIIEQAAFASCYSLKTVTVPKSLKEIRNLAFFNCINLDINLDEQLCETVANDAFLGCAAAKKTTYVLKGMTISEIEKSPISSFYVKDYQRGYRWTKNEVEELLCDIYETEEKYCLQPLIVKESIMGDYKALLDNSGIAEATNSTNASSTVYELIDGQQRLTTLFLILTKCCDGSKANARAPQYRIYYELLRKIDDKYILKAKETIDNWFKNKGFDSNSYKTFADKIREQLFFVWYEMKTDPNLSVEKEFRNINDGQTPLTNAELFKAMLLNPENAETHPDGHKEEIKEKLFEMAYEWDKLEQDLRNENFWFFISNSECSERTHLDYLFELYGVRIASMECYQSRRAHARKRFDWFMDNISQLDRTRERYSFLAIKAFVEYLCQETGKNKFNNIRDVWNDIVAQYHRLYSWFKDSELYHSIGYLVATEKKSANESIVPTIIADLFTEGYGGRITSTDFLIGENKAKAKPKNLPALKNYVQERIQAHLKGQFEGEEDKTVFSPNYYLRNKKEIRDFLLYVNIWSTHQAGERFLFDKFKNDRNGKEAVSWDIEHVSARNLKVDITANDIEKTNIKEWWQQELKAMGEPEPTEWNEEAWRSFAKKVNEVDPDNSISNLVLLDSQTNRSYGNALFLGKRAEIIDRDMKNTYIPICTKNVFLKYYTPKPDVSAAWTDRDRIFYLEIICNCIKDGIYQNNNVPKAITKKLAEIKEAKEKNA